MFASNVINIEADDFLVKNLLLNILSNVIAIVPLLI